MAPCATKKHKENQNIKKISVGVLIVSFTTILTPINRGGFLMAKALFVTEASVIHRRLAKLSSNEKNW